MTDLEGVPGVLDSEHWCNLGSQYYELPKEDHGSGSEDAPKKPKWREE